MVLLTSANATCAVAALSAAAAIEEVDNNSSPAQPGAIGSADGEVIEAGSDDDQTSLANFKVGDKVRVYWPMEEPPEWFDGYVEKICAVTLKIQYPATNDHQHHNPKTWDIVKVV